MKIKAFSAYAGKAITRQYKRAKTFTYLGSAAGGTCLGFSSLFHAANQSGNALLLGSAGLIILKDTFNVYKSLFKIAKPYDAICKRALKIYKHK